MKMKSTTLAAAFGVAARLAGKALSTPSGTASKTPNVLLILTDDQDLLMDSMDYMPNVDRLISQNGTTFQKHYCTMALCCPSRVSLFTGKCVHNTNVTDVRPPYGAYSKFVSQGLNDDYLPLWLRDGGINTYYVGKFSNGHSIDNYKDPQARGWTESNFLLEPGQYDYENTTWALNNQHWKSYPGDNAITLTTENALHMLDKAATAGKPFFLTVAPAVPHVGLRSDGKGSFAPIPQKKWANAFPNAKVPRTKNWNPQNIDGAVSWHQNLPYQNQTLVDELDAFYRARLRAVAGLDDMVAELVAALESYGILENTHVIYTTDNGYHISQHRLGPGKKSGFETDINIPMVWRGPGVPAGKVRNTITTHTDLAPTFLGIFGLPPRTSFDGSVIDFETEAIISTGGAGAVVEHVNVEHWGSANAYELVAPHADYTVKGEDNNTQKSVRLQGANGSYSLYYAVWCTNEHELYDMSTDAQQVDNLLPHVLDISQIAAQAQAPDDGDGDGNGNGKQLLGRPLQKVVARLDALLMVLKSCVGIECTDPWAQLHPQGDVNSLQDALAEQYDQFYASQPKVMFSACKQGYLIEYEGPQQAIHYAAGGGFESGQKMSSNYTDTSGVSMSAWSS